MRIAVSRLFRTSSKTDPYERQLRADSTLFLIPITLVITLVITIMAYIFHIRTMPGANQFVPFLMMGGSAILSRYCWVQVRDQQEEEVEMAGRIFVAGHLILLSLMFWDLWPAFPVMPYTFGFFVVISGTIIYPEASFGTWIASIVLMTGALYASGEYSFENVRQLLAPILVNGSLAVASYFMTLDWAVAAVSAARSHLIASSQRDELFALKQELESANVRLQSLYSQFNTAVAVGQQVAKLIDLDTLLDEVAQLIHDQLNYSFIGIFMPDATQTKLTLRTQSSRNDVNINFTTLHTLHVTDQHIIGTAMRTGELVYAEDVLVPGYRAHPYKLVGTRSEAAFPLVAGQKVLGVLTMQSQTTGTFNAEQVQLLQVLADEVAIAIQNATLYQQVITRNKLMGNLNNIGRAISSTLEQEKVLDLILENLSRLVTADRHSVWLKNDKHLTIAAQVGFPEDIDWQSLIIPTDRRDDVFTQVLYGEQPVTLPDAADHPEWNNVSGLSQVRSWLGVPLITTDRGVGLLAIARVRRDPFTQDEIELTATFASQAAVALANASLYDKTRQFNQQLESEVRFRTKELLEAYDRLERLDKTKSNFIQVTSHELRTPITVLRGYSDMLLRDPIIQGNDYHKQLVEGIRSGSIRMHDIVNDMLDVVKIESRSFDIFPEKIYLSALLQSIIRKLQPALSERNLTIHMDGIDDLGPIEADRDAVRKLFYHLIINAIKYTPDGRSITISGMLIFKGPENQRPYIQVVVADQGIGIDPAYHDLIFTKFYQTGEVSLHSSSRTKYKGGGPGIGLAIVEGFVEAHHGAVWVESEGFNEETCPGSSFYVQLPVSQSNI